MASSPLRNAALGFGLILSLMIAISLIGNQRVGFIDRTLTDVGDGAAVKQRYAINFRGSVHDRAIAIRDAVLGGLHFDLPLPNTTGLTQLAPALGPFTLSVELSRPVYLRRGYLMLDGALRGNLPAPAALLP